MEGRYEVMRYLGETEELGPNMLAKGGLYPVLVVDVDGGGKMASAIVGHLANGDVNHSIRYDGADALAADWEAGDVG